MGPLDANWGQGYTRLAGVSLKVDVGCGQARGTETSGKTLLKEGEVRIQLTPSASAPRGLR